MELGVAICSGHTGLKLSDWDNFLLYSHPNMKRTRFFNFFFKRLIIQLRCKEFGPVTGNSEAGSQIDGPELARENCPSIIYSGPARSIP